jgi:protein-S-isoprenylcysteine O-methyltransferase Ste14
MKRLIQGVCALTSYAVGISSLLYFCGFMLNVVVPKGIDTGPADGIGQSLLINTVLLLAFLLPHSIMARPRFKRWLTRFVPAQLERSTYILVAGLTLLLLVWQWRPITAVLWSFDAGFPTHLAYASYALGWIMMLISTVSIDHLTFFGLRPAWQGLVGTAAKHSAGLSQHGFYGYVRHPISLGWMLVLVSTPTMSLGHLMFATVMVAYILLVTPLEEQDIEDELGDQYRAYRRKVRAFLPVRKA